MERLNRPLMIVLSAPSGAGKSTLCEALLRRFDGLGYSVSCTTRPPRGQERDGQDYRFVDESRFLDLISEGAFLEHARVHGNRYGTLKRTVLDRLAAGESVILDIDVQGADQVRGVLDADAPELAPLRRAFVDIFIEPPDIEALRRRLTGRGEDAPEVIERRLAAAEAELACRNRYRYRVVNNDLDRAVDDMVAILRRESGGPDCEGE